MSTADSVKQQVLNYIESLKKAHMLLSCEMNLGKNY